MYYWQPGHIGVSGPSLSKCLQREHSGCPAMNLFSTSCKRTDAFTSANARRTSVSNSIANTDGSSPGLREALPNCHQYSSIYQGSHRWKLIGTTGGVFCHRVARIILVCLFRVPGGCPFYHRSKSTGGGIKMATAISTVEAAIFTILK